MPIRRMTDLKCSTEWKKEGGHAAPGLNPSPAGDNASTAARFASRCRPAAWPTPPPAASRWPGRPPSPASETALFEPLVDNDDSHPRPNSVRPPNRVLDGHVPMSSERRALIMAPGRPRDPRKERHWRRCLQLWQHSGLTVHEFCDRHHLVEGSFYAWRRLLQQRDAGRLRRLSRSSRKSSRNRPAPRSRPGRRPLRPRATGFDAATCGGCWPSLEEAPPMLSFPPAVRIWLGRHRPIYARASTPWPNRSGNTPGRPVVGARLCLSQYAVATGSSCSIGTRMAM